MEIIRKRQNHIEKYAQWNCRNCGSTIKSGITEGKMNYDQRDGDYVSVTCPVCNTVNSVSVSCYKAEADHNAKLTMDYYNK